MGIYTDAIQKLYVAYFNRPADTAGLTYWEGVVTAAKGNTSAVSAAFSASAEYKAAYAGMDEYHVVAQVYQNLFGHAPDLAGLNFWGQNLINKAMTIDNVVTSIAAGAQSTDLVAYNSKVAAATAFTTALDTPAKVLAYSGVNANGVAKQFISTVTDDASLKAAIAPAALAGTVQTVVDNAPQVVGSTFNLTLGVDTIVGTAGNDTINVGIDLTSSTSTLTGLDAIDGGAGNDTLIITDAIGGKTDFTKGTITNVENLKVVSLANVGATAGTVDISAISVLKNATFSVADTAATTFTAGTGVAANITNSTAQAVTLKGFGGAVSVTNAAAAVTIGQATTPVAADANAITSATVKGATTVAITDNSGSSGAIGTKLTTVTLDGNSGAATLTGDAIANVTVKNGTATSNVTIANTTAHALNLTANKVVTGAIITDATATSATVTATGSNSAFALAATKAASLTIAGDKNLTLDKVGSDYAKLTTVTSNSTGKFTADLSGALLLTTVTATSGTADITIAGTNSAATPAAQSVTTGAGNDKVTITGTLGKGSTLSLGDGSDTVAVTTGVITADAIVDAGAGVDTLSLKLVGSANVGAFKNFENFDVAGASVAFDAVILAANNTVNNFVGTAATAAAISLNNLGAGVGFIVKGDMGTTNAVTLTQASAGAITVTSDADVTTATGAAHVTAAKFSTNATSVKAVFDNNNADAQADVASGNAASLDITAAVATTVSIVSGGTEVNNTLTFTAGATKLTSAVVTGDKNLTLDFNTSGALASVDASGQTAGGLKFNMVDLTSTGTIKLGAGNDVITLVGADFTAATDVQKVSGLGLGTVENAATQSGFDVLAIAGAAVQAADHTAATAADFAIKDGVITFGGAGPATLGAAVALLDTALAANEAVVFQYAGNYYVFGAGASTAVTDDVLVQVVGVTTIHGLDNVAGGVYLF